jgi:glycosyltransferase involved in cell wall biosynthesis
MRVVFVAGSAQMGGTERNVLRLSGALRARGLVVEVVLLGAGGPLLEDFRRQQIPVSLLSWTYRARAFPTELRRLTQTLRERRPDLVQSFGYPTIWWGVLAALGGTAAARVIAIQAWDTWKGRMERMLDRAVAPAVHLAIADGEGARRFAAEQQGLPAERTRTLYDGVDPADVTPHAPRADVRSSLGVPAAAPVIGVVARLDDAHKGQSVLLQAAPRVLATRPDAFFVLVGEGSDRASLEAQADRQGIRDRVRFPGTRADLGDVLAALDLLVIPSRRFESLPKILVEGMAASRPIVASRVGDIPELLEDGRTGRLVPPEDPLALAEVILDCLADANAARAMGAAAREAIGRRGLTLPATAEALQGLYEELLRVGPFLPPPGTRVRIWAAALAYLASQAVRSRRRRAGRGPGGAA